MALISPFTLFLIAPLALLFSLFGLRRSPRGMATWGFVLSILATAVLSVGIFGIAAKRNSEMQRHQAYLVKQQNLPRIQATMVTLKQAIEELREFRNDNDKQLPSLDQGMNMTVRHNDAWDTPLRYSTADYGCKVRSAGPDQKFDSNDDLVLALDGKPMSYTTSVESLLQ